MKILIIEDYGSTASHNDEDASGGMMSNMMGH